MWPSGHADAACCLWENLPFKAPGLQVNLAGFAAPELMGGNNIE
jgi:hypothetical protein